MMGLFRRVDRTAYAPIDRPKMHRSRVLFPKWAEGTNLGHAMRMADRAYSLLNSTREANQVAIDDTAPHVELLLSRLLQAPDPIGIAAGKDVLYESCMGWAFGQVEYEEWKCIKGLTHPVVHNGMVMYCGSGSQDEYKGSLVLAFELGYYVARMRIDGIEDSPELVLSELY